MQSNSCYVDRLIAVCERRKGFMGGNIHKII